MDKVPSLRICILLLPIAWSANHSCWQIWTGGHNEGQISKHAPGTILVSGFFCTVLAEGGVKHRLAM